LSSELHVCSPAGIDAYYLVLSCRDFRARNPAVAQFDKFLKGQADPRPVSALFVAKQLEHMRSDQSTEEAYDLAKIWLVENGYEVLERMGVTLSDMNAAERRAALLAAHKRARQEQVERTRRALASAAVIGRQTMAGGVKRAIEGRAGATPGSRPDFLLQPSAGDVPPVFDPAILDVSLSDMDSDIE